MDTSNEPNPPANRQRDLLDTIRSVLGTVGLMFLCTGIGGVAFMWWLFGSEFSPFAGAFSNGCFSHRPEKIQAVARFVLPPSATNLESYCAGLQGWSASAKFEMAPSDLQNFIDDTLITTPLSATFTNEFSGFKSFFPGYTETPKSFLYGRYEVHEFLQEVLIDTGNPEKYIVYLLVLAG